MNSKEGPSDDLTVALHKACEEESFNRIKFLLDSDVDVNSKDSKGNTALHRVLLLNKSPSVVEFLLKNGARIDIVNNLGETPLHIASKGQRLENIRLILESGVDLSAVSAAKHTVLHFAASGSEEIFKLIVKLTVDYGIINVNSAAVCGSTPVDMVNSCSKLVELCKRGGSSKFKDGLLRHLIFQSHDGQCPVIACSDGLMVSGMETDDMPLAHRLELRAMGSKIIASYPTKSLLDLLFMKRNCLVRYADNKNLRREYKECGEDFETKYPYYGCLLNLRYCQSLKRRNLVDACTEWFIKTLGTDSYEGCAEEIFGYVGEEELRALENDLLFGN